MASHRSAVDEGERLFRAVLEDPEDWDARRVLADWCEEQGDLERADCLRWMADEKKRALGGHRYWWYNADEWVIVNSDPESNLPKRLFREMAFPNHWAFSLPSRRESEEAVVRTWRKLGGVIR